MTALSESAPARKFTEADYEDFEHTGPGTLMGAWLRTFWHPIYLSDELKQDWPRQVRLLGQNFALYRGESGKAYLTQPTCAHRGTRLDLGWVEGEKITCRYHGWQFNGGTGECVRQPLEPRPFCNSVKIRAYPVEEYLGMIFVYLGDGDPPPMERYPRLEAPNVVLEPTVNYSDYNYLQNRENDPLHTAFTHASFDGAGFQIRGVSATVKSKETCWGYNAEVVTEDGIKQTMQYGMPLANIVAGGGGMGADAKLKVITEHYGWKLPVDDTHGVHFTLFVSFVPPEHLEEYKERRAKKKAELAARSSEKKRMSIREASEGVLAGKIKLDDLMPDDIDPPEFGLILVQDWVVQGGQGAIHLNRKQDRLGASDAQVAMLRRLLRRELQAFAEGRPNKQWRYDESEVAASWSAPGETVTTELRTVKREAKTMV